jgi:hypothetical protein
MRVARAARHQDFERHRPMEDPLGVGMITLELGMLLED